MISAQINTTANTTHRSRCSEHICASSARNIDARAHTLSDMSGWVITKNIMCAFTLHVLRSLQTLENPSLAAPPVILCSNTDADTSPLPSFRATLRARFLPDALGKRHQSGGDMFGLPHVHKHIILHNIRSSEVLMTC